ncbi:hypothetical protein AAMO2058_000976700 [Amorphochlora amoebiformis]
MSKNSSTEQKPGFKVVDKKEHKASLRNLLSAREAKCPIHSNPSPAHHRSDTSNRSEIDVKNAIFGSVSKRFTCTCVWKRQLVEPLDGFVLSNVLSKEECEKLRKGVATDGQDYTFWNPEDTNSKHTRNVDTIEVFDESLAAGIWERVKMQVTNNIEIPEENDDWEFGLEGKWEAYGINPKMLFARYPEGGHFSPHTDGHQVIDFNHRSLHSVIIYLNDCSEGGATQLFKPEDYKDKKFIQDKQGRFRFSKEKVADRALPKAGSMLSFSQHHMHEGEPVGSGCSKFIIRTDVMYRRVPAVCDKPNDVEAYQCYQAAMEAEANAEHDKAGHLYTKVGRLSEKLARMLNIWMG